MKCPDCGEEMTVYIEERMWDEAWGEWKDNVFHVSGSKLVHSEVFKIFATCDECGYEEEIEATWG